MPGIAYICLVAPTLKGTDANKELEKAYDKLRGLEDRFKVKVDKSINQAVYSTAGVVTNLNLGYGKSSRQEVKINKDACIEDNADYKKFLESRKWIWYQF